MRTGTGTAAHAHWQRHGLLRRGKCGLCLAKVWPVVGTLDLACRNARGREYAGTVALAYGTGVSTSLQGINYRR